MSRLRRFSRDWCVIDRGGTEKFYFRPEDIKGINEYDHEGVHRTLIYTSIPSFWFFTSMTVPEVLNFVQKFDAQPYNSDI